MMRPEILPTKEDFLQLEADAVVNSANDMLVLGSNVAGRIATRGGEELKTFLQKVLDERSREPLSLGTAVASPAFGIQGTKFIIHAVSLGSRKFAGPEGRRLATVSTLFNAVRSSLRLADSLHCSSIVFPMMLGRPGYSVLDLDPTTLRWVMSSVMVLAIQETGSELEQLHRIIISTFNEDDPVLIDEDFIRISMLLREPDYLSRGNS